MTLKECELKIFYAGGLNKTLDKDLEEILEKHDYSFQGSGMEMKSWIRDLAFEKCE